MIFGLFVSVGYILLKALFHHGIDRPDQLEELGMSVYASVPLSEWQRKKDVEALAKRHVQGKTDPHNTCCWRSVTRPTSPSKRFVVCVPACTSP